MIEPRELSEKRIKARPRLANNRLRCRAGIEAHPRIDLKGDKARGLDRDLVRELANILLIKTRAHRIENMRLLFIARLRPRAHGRYRQALCPHL